MKEMKNSGIEWIGKIPIEWTICRFKNIANIYNGNSIKDEDKEKYEDANDAIPYIATKDVDVTFQTIAYDNGMYVKKDDTGFKRAPKNSTLLCIEGGSAGKKIAFTNQDVCFINKLCCFYSESICNKFLFYYMLSPAFAVEFKNHLSGLIGGVSISEIKDFSIVLPKNEEQQKIASFLDRKCAEIDAVIDKTKATIEEYKKLKQSVITEAVTKGIRGDRPMKDSGIECIGEIPKSFSKYRIKNIGEIFGRIGFRGYTTDDLVEEGNGAITLSPSNLKDMTMNYSKLSYLSWEKYEESPEIKIYDGDILMVKTGSSYGKTALVTDLPLESTINPQLVVIKNISIDSKFLLYCFQTPYFLDQVENAVVGGTIPTMSQEKINNFFVFVPELKEQKEIAEYLDEKCAEIDTLIAKKTALLEEIESYKKSVIYEYVTGKKEVR